MLPGILLTIMAKKNSRGKLFFLTMIISMFIGITVYWCFIPLSIIVKTEAGIVLSVPTHPSDTLSLRFTHSVHKTPVWENFIVVSVDQLTLTSTEYQSYGVGMPSLPSEGVFTQLGDRFMLTNLNRSFSQIPVRVGPEAKLSLFHGGEEYPLHEWFEPGTLVFVTINYDYTGFIFSKFNTVK